jgi:hypothetical protein
MSLRLSVESGDAASDFEELSDWLRQEEGLRGLITEEDAAPTPGELGTAIDVLIAAVGSSGALTVLLSSLQAFIATRGSDISIRLMGKGGREVTVDAKRVKDPGTFLRDVRSLIE